MGPNTKLPPPNIYIIKQFWNSAFTSNSCILPNLTIIAYNTIYMHHYTQTPIRKLKVLAYLSLTWYKTGIKEPSYPIK